MTESRARRRKGAVETATTREISRMPKDLRESALAASAIDVARAQDETPRTSAASGMSRAQLAHQLRMTMSELHDLAPDEPTQDGVDDLQRRRAERRAAAGS